MGAIINGPVQSPGDIHIDGLVIGDVQCDTLVVGKNGEVKGNVTSQIATIRGKVSGDVRARMIQLATTGSIDGDLTHAILIIEEGGQFEGRSIRSTDPLANTAIKPAHLEASLKPEPASKSIKSEEQAGSTGDEADYADQPRSSVAEALGDTFSVKA
jgi:cytoskeletal protein CcmA (bactofilin family)